MKQKEIFLKSSRIINTKNSNPQGKISELELEINRMVYELYGLTEEEIRLIEESVTGK
ncbi:MAG: hypothetical protein IIB44_13745 [Candidatus Marinimicrobia bacterium]|nr:hypothetical protein [Candidatus Neomarinimicrobiota bacterium]